jgi:hypothetical protein
MYTNPTSCSGIIKKKKEECFDVAQYPYTKMLMALRRGVCIQKYKGGRCRGFEP